MQKSFFHNFMILDDITPIIITWNEAPNIGRTLKKLTWARDIVVIDSGSTDDTLSIVAGFPQARVVSRSFDSFAGQCNFGLGQVKTEWVLSLDADYLLTDELVDELRTLDAKEDVAGYTARFVYCVHGRPLRASLYPPRAVLYRRQLAQYEDDGHGHRVAIRGATAMLGACIRHDDRKPMSRWLASQDKYARLEAKKLLSLPPERLHFNDRLRRTIVLGPVLVLFYTLLVRGVILDGWHGWFYAFERMLAELMLSLRLLETRLNPGTE